MYIYLVLEFASPFPDQLALEKQKTKRAIKKVLGTI
jgi:hypothetical protein